MRDVVIVAAKRTPVGSFGGGFSSLRAHQLGTAVIEALLEETGILGTQVDEVILGQALTAGCGQNPARQAALGAGLPATTPALTINKVCGSGLKAVQMAAQAIRSGDADLIIAGGQECMSQAPHAVPNSRQGQRMGHWPMIDTMIHDGLWDAFNGYHMGVTAENIAQKYAITREEQDDFAAKSQEKAALAIDRGLFDDQIVPVAVPQRKGTPKIISKDECPRTNITADNLAKLRPAFHNSGTVTAGNASSLNDGAAAVIICSANKARQLGLIPMATIKSQANAGVDPTLMGTGPIPASKRCLELAGWSVDGLDLIEANEAFAVQAISVNRDMNWDTSKVNVNGGAIAIGHPIGASGCRILVTLLHEMVRRNSKRGLATLCIGGGMGVALAVER